LEEKLSGWSLTEENILSPIQFISFFSRADCSRLLS
jgi:hypothetical protein